MDTKLPAGDDRAQPPGSTLVDVQQDGRIIIHAEITSNAQLAGLKVLIDGLASQELFPVKFDDG